MHAAAGITTRAHRSRLPSVHAHFWVRSLGFISSPSLSNSRTDFPSAIYCHHHPPPLFAFPSQGAHNESGACQLDIRMYTPKPLLLPHLCPFWQLLHQFLRVLPSSMCLSLYRTAFRQLQTPLDSGRNTYIAHHMTQTHSFQLKTYTNLTPLPYSPCPITKGQRNPLDIAA